MQERETKKSPRAPDWDKYLNDENYHDFVTYAKGAKMYSLNYWTFVRLAKEAGASWPLRKTAVVDLLVLDEYMENNKREADQAGKGRLMASRKNIDDMNEAVRKGKKFIRECRVKMGMTQEELAEAIYTKKCTISAYETGKIDIKVSILRDIAKVLNTTAGYLIDGDEMGFDADVVQLAMMLQEMKNEDVKKVAIEQVKVLAKLNKDA